MISIFECGQGDAAYIDELNLLVDLGDKEQELPVVNAEVKNNKIDVMITHSHDDHLKGASLLDSDKYNTLFMPAYLPECITILEKLHMRGLIIPPRIELVYEEKQLYDKQVTVLNPPLEPWNYWSKVGKISMSEVQEMLSSLNLSLSDIIDAVNEVQNSYTHTKEFDNKIADDERQTIQKIINNTQLFIESVLKVITYYYKQCHDISKAVNYFEINDANVFSVIFSYKAKNSHKYLFTGDANKAQFKRILKKDEKALECDFLKVPHHGSKNSLNEKYLRKMHPKVAVISHDNGLFGRAKDPHPNKEIINLLENENIDYYSTNDIIKNGTIIKQKYRGQIKGFDVSIV